MMTKQFIRLAGRGLGCGAGLAAGAYATYAAVTWCRYGKVRARFEDERDPILDQFMPTYEVVERHHVRVGAPADMTFAAACGVDFQHSVLIRAIFKGRELMRGGDRARSERPRGLLALTKSLGWGVLAEVQGREVVVGAVTQPWQANVVFRALPPETFVAFNEPDYVKIVWTLRADAINAGESVARTETRVATTDPGARRKFRRYWSVVSPGVVIIRRVALTLVKAEAERRFRGTASADRFDRSLLSAPPPERRIEGGDVLRSRWRLKIGDDLSSQSSAPSDDHIILTKPARPDSSQGLNASQAIRWWGQDEGAH